MRTLVPGDVVFKLITLLVGLIRNERRRTVSGGATETGRSQIAKAEVDPVIRIRQCFRAVARHDLDQHLIKQVGINSPCPSAQDAEIPHKETAAIGRGICYTGDSRMEVIMSVTCAQGESVTVALQIIKTHDYVMQPVWRVENTIISIEDLGKLGIVCW